MRRAGCRAPEPRADPLPQDPLMPAEASAETELPTLCALCLDRSGAGVERQLVVIFTCRKPHTTSQGRWARSNRGLLSLGLALITSWQRAAHRELSVVRINWEPTLR